MKTRWERHCQLRGFDNWCLQHPHKANLLAIATGVTVFAVAQLLEHLPPFLFLTVIFGFLAYIAFAAGAE